MIACIAKTCGMSAVCLLTFVGMPKVILPWELRNQTVAATYSIGKSRAQKTARSYAAAKLASLPLTTE